MRGSRIARAAAVLAAALVAAVLTATALADKAAVERISTGPEGGNAAEDARANALSADGSRAVFQTARRPSTPRTRTRRRTSMPSTRPARPTGSR